MRHAFGGQFVNSSTKYVYNSWPFGLSSAPYLCQTSMSHVTNYITQVTGLKAFVYLDDFLIQVASGDETVSEEELKKRVTWVLKLFWELGLIINEGSNLFPARELKWLGFNLNTIYREC